MNFLGIFILLAFSINIFADESKIKDIYKSKNITGSIVIESLDGEFSYKYNSDNNEAFIPASTFKIPNTLIILEEGLIKDQFEVIKWDGVKRAYPPWNQDHTLKSAFQYSCVWCYQRYAAMLSDEKYRSYLKHFNYGNQITGKDITSFWLDGDLRISVNGQISFLRKVYDEDLPIHEKHIKTLKNIMLSENNDHFKVWAKTGWSGKSGWYVGYLIADNSVWLFSNHIEINSRADLKYRKELAMESFKALNILK
ncbi:MAG: penicillin-binding transpeptidase domain-containing protein [Candidatus Thiodiazotropha sp.]